MPTYTYRCPECKFTEDITHSIKDHEYIPCKDCKNYCMKKVPTASGIHFKGTGFYETDYKGK